MSAYHSIVQYKYLCTRTYVYPGIFILFHLNGALVQVMIAHKVISLLCVPAEYYHHVQQPNFFWAELIQIRENSWAYS